MTKLMKMFNGKKTYLVCAVSIAYAVVVVGWQAGDWTASTQMVLAALGAAGLRNGME